MKHILLPIAALAFAPALFACSHECDHACDHEAQTVGGERPMLTAEVEAPETITVTLDGLEGALDNRHVFNGFGCTGENHSPAISWSGAPEGTRSFVLEVHDPDAPTGVGFFHWIVVNLPPSTTSLPFDAAAAGLPEGAVQTRTDFGTSTFGGPCPPPGTPHRYVFTVYALDTESLGPDAGTAPAVVRFMLRSHTLAVGRAVGTFGFATAP
jgi:Raf kinase inhibitor-like YbhB/YbcL family protein